MPCLYIYGKMKISIKCVYVRVLFWYMHRRYRRRLISDYQLEFVFLSTESKRGWRDDNSKSFDSIDTIKYVHLD